MSATVVVITADDLAASTVEQVPGRMSIIRIPGAELRFEVSDEELERWLNVWRVKVGTFIVTRDEAGCGR